MKGTNHHRAHGSCTRARGILPVSILPIYTWAIRKLLEKLCEPDISSRRAMPRINTNSSFTWDLPGLSPQLLTFCVSVRSEYSRAYHLWPYSQQRWTKWAEKNKFRKREFFPESVSVEDYENKVRQLGGRLPSLN